MVLVHKILGGGVDLVITMSDCSAHVGVLGVRETELRISLMPESLTAVSPTNSLCSSYPGTANEKSLLLPLLQIRGTVVKGAPLGPTVEGYLLSRNPPHVHSHFSPPMSATDLATRPSFPSFSKRQGLRNRLRTSSN